jgi:hypothetical protein
MMRIIFEQDNGIVAILGVKQSVTDLKAAAKKFVPKGKRFKIIDESEFPEDIFYEAWRVDFAENDGVGEKE